MSGICLKPLDLDWFFLFFEYFDEISQIAVVVGEGGYIFRINVV